VARTSRHPSSSFSPSGPVVSKARNENLTTDVIIVTQIRYHRASESADYTTRMVGVSSFRVYVDLRDTTNVYAEVAPTKIPKNIRRFGAILQPIRTRLSFDVRRADTGFIYATASGEK
jgi:hypothetical protein